MIAFAMNYCYRQHLTPSGCQTLSSKLRQTGWSGSIGKRIFDVIAAIAGLALLSPFMLLTALAVKLSSPGPVLFRQARMGRCGREFVIFKFRTMRIETQGGPGVTRKGDARLTSLGMLLRRFKLDELPQLYNVLKGDMSLVGARPKLPHHQTYVLEYRPGITGAASLAFRNEECLVQQVPVDDLDAYQIEVLMPLKRQIDSNYMREATFWSDIRLLLATVTGRGERLAAADVLRFQESLLSLDAAVRVHYADSEGVEDTAAASMASA